LREQNLLWLPLTVEGSLLIVRVDLNLSIYKQSEYEQNKGEGPFITEGIGRFSYR
jgi:hypothetical protein